MIYKSLANIPISVPQKERHIFKVGEILDIFTVIGFCATIYFIDKVLHERKMCKLADETSRKLREERGRERLEAEWSNMTKANTPAMFHPAIGWLVRSDRPNTWVPRKTNEMRRGEEPTTSGP